MGTLHDSITKSKLARILSGWKNYVFENEEIELIAKKRAEGCSDCPLAVKGWYAELINDEMKDVEGLVCNGCDGAIKCPLSTKLRSREETCPQKKW